MAAFEAKHRSPSAAELHSEPRVLPQFQPRQLFPDEQTEAEAPRTHGPVLSSIKRRSKVMQRMRASSDDWSPKKRSGSGSGNELVEATPPLLQRKRGQKKRNSNSSSSMSIGGNSGEGARPTMLAKAESPKASPKKEMRRLGTHWSVEAKEVPDGKDLKQIREKVQERQTVAQPMRVLPKPSADLQQPTAASTTTDAVIAAGTPFGSAEVSAKRNDEKITLELEKASAHARMHPSNGATVHKFALWQKAKPKAVATSPVAAAVAAASAATEKQQDEATNGYFARHLREAIDQAQAQTAEAATGAPQSTTLESAEFAAESDTTTEKRFPRRRSSRLRTLIEQLESIAIMDDGRLDEKLELPMPASASSAEEATSSMQNLEDSIQEEEELKVLGPFPVGSQEELTSVGEEMYIATARSDEEKHTNLSSASRAQSPPLSVASGDGYGSEEWEDNEVVFQAPQASPSPPPPPPSSPSHRYSPLAKAADDDNHTVTPIAHGKGEHLRVTFPIRQTPAESAVKHQRRPSYNELESRNSRETFATGNGSSRLSWRQGEVVGTGTFGKVYRGLNTKTGELLAIKQVCLAEGTEEEVDMLRKEITLMHSLRHPHIVRYIGTDISDRYLYIILEYVPGGSIASLLATFGPFSEDLMRKFTYQILLGVKYLHERGIMHRDIKGANVLVTDQGIAKLADFGCSKQLQGMCTASLEESLQSIRGSVPWMAPEVIKQTGHGRSADIWSLGATMIEMTTASHPWPNFGNNLAAMFHVATSTQPPPIPEQLSNTAKSFMRRCLQVDPEKRGTAAELCHHEFVRPEETAYNSNALYTNELHFAQGRHLERAS